MNTKETMLKIAKVPAIFDAAMLLEKHCLLLHGETAADVVKRYIEANPDIKEHISMFHSS